MRLKLRARPWYGKCILLLTLALLLLGLAGCVARPVPPDPGDEPPIVDPGPPGPEPGVEDPPYEDPPYQVPSVSLIKAYPGLTFSRPLEYQHADDGSNLVFVVEQSGRILVFDNDPGVTGADVFLDLRSRVDSSGSEKGLLGLAFHPQYGQRGLFYVNYANRTHSVIAEYKTNPDNPRQALIDSERILLTFAQPYANHNGGCLAFGPEGYLYIATGDGGSAGDPGRNAQNLANLLGKILRIDVDRTQGQLAYAIPADNPWAGNTSGFREEIYAYGLRNPWKFSFDGDGRLWVADVGQNAVEEINLVGKGLNYGWNIMEGSECYPASASCSSEGLELPVWEYRHPLGRSVTGGYVYSGTEIESLLGHYIYGDYVTGLIWALRVDGLDEPTNHLLLESGLRISSFGVDADHELYVLDLRGVIYRLTEAVSR